MSSNRLHIRVHDVKRVNTLQQHTKRRLEGEILAFRSAVIPDVWLKEGQRGKKNMWLVPPALWPGQLSCAVARVISLFTIIVLQCRA